MTPAKPANTKNGKADKETTHNSQKANNAKSEALARRTQQIDQAVTTGRLGPLEAEFMKFMQNRTDAPQANRETIRAWQETNGTALKAERSTRRASTKPQRDAARAKARAHRTQQIDQAIATGRLAPLQAEFMKLMHNQGDDPQTHREAVRAWQKEHGESLKAERKARNSKL